MSPRRNQADRRARARKSALAGRQTNLDLIGAGKHLRGEGFGASLAIVLGSGLRAVCDELQIERELPYSKAPGFIPPSAPGHAGRLIQTRLGSCPALVLSGRGHFYEGLTMEEVTFPVRVLAELGVESLILTNAAGGIEKRLSPGDLMLIRDHINFMGTNPLRGQSAGAEGFVDLSAVYDSGLRRLLRRSAKKMGVELREGVYLAVAGPSYETPAEVQAFARLGADAVGMSTVPEAIVARQMGLRVAGLSCITNRAAGLHNAPLTHRDVLQKGREMAGTAADLLREFGRLYAEVR